MHITRKFWSVNFCGSYGPFHIEILLKNTWWPLSPQLLWNYWTEINETWYVWRTAYVVVHITRKFWSVKFCGSYSLLHLENFLQITCSSYRVQLLGIQLKGIKPNLASMKYALFSWVYYHEFFYSQILLKHW